MKKMIKNTIYIAILSILFSFGLIAQESSDRYNGTKIDKNITKVKAEQPTDTFEIKNKIQSVYNDGEQYFVKLSMAEESEIRLEVYNMLAKPVKTIYSGKATVDKERTYEFNASSLPNGIYFVILQGNGFRYPYKITIRR